MEATKHDQIKDTHICTETYLFCWYMKYTRMKLHKRTDYITVRSYSAYCHAGKKTIFAMAGIAIKRERKKKDIISHQLAGLL